MLNAVNRWRKRGCWEVETPVPTEAVGIWAPPIAFPALEVAALRTFASSFLKLQILCLPISEVNPHLLNNRKCFIVGTVSKESAEQAWKGEFESQYPHKSWAVHRPQCWWERVRDRDSGLPGAPWAANLAEWMSSRLSGRLIPASSSHKHPREYVCLLPQTRKNTLL